VYRGNDRGIERFAQEFPSLVSNVRGRGLMAAFDLQSGELRDTALRRFMANDVMVLSSGEGNVSECGNEVAAFKAPMASAHSKRPRGSDPVASFRLPFRLSYSLLCTSTWRPMPMVDRNSAFPLPLVLGQHEPVFGRMA